MRNRPITVSRSFSDKWIELVPKIGSYLKPQNIVVKVYNFHYQNMSWIQPFSSEEFLQICKPVRGYIDAFYGNSDISRIMDFLGKAQVASPEGIEIYFIDEPVDIYIKRLRTRNSSHKVELTTTKLILDVMFDERVLLVTMIPEHRPYINDLLKCL